ncbi:hypothetical protein H4R18_001624 [Coemansia javaensis]|uniref:Uncharacterized protein n=1 Tax=Coemansia javaensis TaxID=2761396 RepID=A0A9W8HC82_9FUNG|nr:hypothetical protein H4R18_001624 [Coemansia javaensis]
MNIPLTEKVRQPHGLPTLYRVTAGRVKSMFYGENFALLIVYCACIAAHVMMAILVFGGEGNAKIGDDVAEVDTLADFGFAMDAIANVVVILLNVLWISMCIWWRRYVIGGYDVHKGTNLSVEFMFILTQICLIASDRGFIKLVPSQLTLQSLMYPLAATLIGVLCILLLYIGVSFLAWFVKRGCGTVSTTPDGSERDIPPEDRRGITSEEAHGFTLGRR